MQIHLLRNATMRFGYAGQTFITDPYLAARHSRPSFTGRSPNPTVELPCTPDEAIRGIGMAIVSHLHSDHFDPTAQKLLAKPTQIVCQPGDARTIGDMGFETVLPVEKQIDWRGISIIRTGGRHGSGAVLDDMGTVSGFVFQAEGEPTVYWTGDTVWCDAVAETIAIHQPEVILTHSCGAVWGEQVLIVMDAAQTIQVCRAAPRATVVAIHMEALDHATVTREELRRFADAHGIGPERLLIPADGETLRI